VPDRPSRIEGFSYRGIHRYFLTICTSRRQRFFEDASSVELALLHILRAARDERMEITVYCFMPDHVHLFVTGTEQGSDLRRFVRFAKQRSGYAFKRAAGRSLWQEGYVDRVVRSDEEAHEKLRYMLANPIRAGLVERIDDYPFIGSPVWPLAQIADLVQDGVTRRRRT
jgi:putative transposase